MKISMGRAGSCYGEIPSPAQGRMEECNIDLIGGLWQGNEEGTLPRGNK